jgi:hypothetical protein
MQNEILGTELTNMWALVRGNESQSGSRSVNGSGPTRLERVKAMLESGCYHQEKNGDQQAHKHWIRLLLRHYYDPMYDYQLQKRMKKSPLLTGRKNVAQEVPEIDRLLEMKPDARAALAASTASGSYRKDHQ